MASSSQSVWEWEATLVVRALDELPAALERGRRLVIGV